MKCQFIGAFFLVFDIQWIHLSVSATDWNLSWSSIQGVCLWQKFIFTLTTKSSILHNIYFLSSQKHYQTPVHNVTYGHSFLLHIKSCSPQIRVCFISFKLIQILNSAVSGEVLQVAFSFQNSAKVTYVGHFFNFKCVLQMFI